jgi:hypothetical protein
MATERQQLQPAFETRGFVDIVRVISDETGVNKGTVRSQIAQGSISIDGELWTGDQWQIPYTQLKDTILIVLGPDRKFVIHYKG